MSDSMAVYKGIAEVTRLMSKDGISKGRQNAQQGYKFRGIDDIYNALSSCLVAANLCIIPRIVQREVVERQTKSGGTLFYVTVHAEYDIVSAVDGSKHVASAYGEAMDSADKATNKAMSAAYKYLAMQLFCIPTEGDNDADAHTPEVAPKPQSMPSVADARARFFARYGNVLEIADATDERENGWLAVQRYLKTKAPEPTTIDGWIAIAEEVRDKAKGK